MTHAGNQTQCVPDVPTFTFGDRSYSPPSHRSEGTTSKGGYKRKLTRPCHATWDRSVRGDLAGRPGDAGSPTGQAASPGCKARASFASNTSRAAARSVQPPEFLAVNTVLGNLKTAFAGAHHAFGFAKYAHR